MAETSTTNPKARTPAEMIGTIVSILGLIAIAIPLLTLGYAKVTGNITLHSTDQVSSWVTIGVILTVVGAGLGLIGTALNLPGVIKRANGARITSTALSGVALVASALFLLLMALPRANNLQTFNSTIVPFGHAIQNDCQTPLNNLTDKTSTQGWYKIQADATANAANDPSFVTAMTNDENLLVQDAKNIQTGITAFQTVTPPAKYQDLYTRCLGDLKGEYDFLTDPNGPSALPLPAPYNKLVAKIDGEQLISDSALVASGAAPIKVPQGTMQQLVITAINAINAQTDPALTADGNQLECDVNTTLNTNLTPIKQDVQGCPSS